MNIYITGIGVVSAIGLTAEENLQSLKKGATGIRRSEQHGLMLGEVKLTNEQLIAQEQLPPADYSRTTLLSLLAAKEAWKGQLHSPRLRTGLISSTSAGGLDRMEERYAEACTNPSAANWAQMVHDNGSTTEHLAQVLGFSGYIGTISTACSSGANAILHGARLLRAGKLDRVLVGGSDPITEFNIRGFSSLNAYAPEICKPFDEDRKGLNLGEGAGFLVLETEQSLAVSKSKPICKLSGWSNATDAFHQTASSGDGKGACLAMQQALALAGLQADQIQYLNAHGTATGNNDLSESVALQTLFSHKVPSFSSTKGFTGHTLAAAGAIEAVYCVLAIGEQACLPNLNFSVPMKETGLIPETTFRSHPGLEHVLSNSFGFGGNCTSLVFSRLPA